jgi:predicted nucleic acid-binding protein
MSGIKAGLLDSNILIYCSKGQIDFKVIAAHFDELFVSVITYMETLGHNFSNPKEKELIEKLLNSLPIVQTDMAIANQVVSYRQQRKIKLPDAVILATAKLLNADVITLNASDFKDIDSSVSVFSPTLIYI